MKKGKNRSQIARKNILRSHKAKARKIEHRAKVYDLKAYDGHGTDISNPPTLSRKQNQQAQMRT